MESSAATNRKVARRSALAATIGNVLEWYDFIMFGFMSVLIARQFFPAGDPYTSLLLVTATTGAGLVFRPIGGILIGMYADRAGRRQALSLVMLLMTLSTLLLVFTPSYSRIGIAATAIVVLARILQAISAGGEFGAATSMLVEYAPAHRKNFYGSWQMFAQSAGGLLSACMGALLTNVFTPQEVDAWAWRIPFCLGLLIGPVGLYMRRAVVETHAFEAVADTGTTSLRTVLAQHRQSVVVATALSGALNVMTYAVIIYLPIYAVENLGLPASVPFTVLVVALALRMAIIPLAGHWADRVGGAALLKGSLIAFLIVLYPCFYWVIHSPGLVSLMASEAIFAVLIGLFMGPMSTFAAVLFPVNVRSTGLSLAYNIGASLIGGITPVFLTWVLHVSGDRFSLAHYCAFFFVLGLAGLARLNRRGIGQPDVPRLIKPE
ncbi:MFS transporter [Burkholderia anthina]|uniref:MFS transporter n=1 Tax=Burkholderia anthina TaxID=179879 RepID=UPI00158B4F96|nr:MFS transporter [Burkholderia anthina]